MIRLAAIFYDALLLFSLLFAITLFMILPFTRGDAVSSDNFLYQVLLGILVYLYFTWQWTHGGQTLGMRAWKIRLINEDGSPIGWRRASLRCVYAVISALCFGMGYIRAVISPDRKTWHDILSQSCLVKSGHDL